MFGDSWSESRDLELSALKLPSELLFESSNLDAVELCVRTVQLEVLLLGQFQKLPVECPLLSSLHLSLVLSAALGMLSADVAAQRLRTSEQLVALIALELLLKLIGGFNQIKLAFDVYGSVSGLW